jgi:hypothetical protein
MANPTTNFGWQMPTATDLVTDLPADFEVFGQAVDTALVDLKGGATGQVLAKASATDMDFSWVDTDDTNAIQNAIVDAKGDLIAASAADTPARLAVGANGETLVADSSTSTGLRYGANFAAGKNKILNGDFSVNQRNFSSETATQYCFDRWFFAQAGATLTCTAETFALGTAPVAGYESKNFVRLAVTTGSDFARMSQLIESVRTFANQTITVSFYAKGTNPTTDGNLKVYLQQNFGTGGSPSATVTVTEQTFVLTANWVRYSFQFTVPSIAGKTLGTANNDYLAVSIGQGSAVSADAWTLYLWGVQAEAGSVATAFQTATGTIQGELAACQRYYFRNNASPTNYGHLGGWAWYTTGTTSTAVVITPPVTMRAAPTSVEYGGTVAITNPSAAATNITALALNQATANLVPLTATATTVAGTLYNLVANNSTTAFVGVSAEL